MDRRMVFVKDWKSWMVTSVRQECNCKQFGKPHRMKTSSSIANRIGSTRCAISIANRIGRMRLNDRVARRIGSMGLNERIGSSSIANRIGSVDGYLRQAEMDRRIIVLHDWKSWMVTSVTQRWTEGWQHLDQ